MIFKIFAIVEMAAFYACYFTKMLAQKKQGIQTDQMGKGKEGFVKFIEVTLKLVTCLTPIVELISIFLFKPLLPEVARWIGALLGVAGVSIFIISVVTMRDSWRAGVSENEKTELVTEGIYQIFAIHWNFTNVFQLVTFRYFSFCNGYVPSSNCKCRGRFFDSDIRGRLH